VLFVFIVIVAVTVIIIMQRSVRCAMLLIKLSWRFK